MSNSIATISNQVVTALKTLDTRLVRLVTSDPLRCASINEYSLACGIPVLDVLSQLEPLLSTGACNLEIVNGEVFLNTCVFSVTGKVTQSGLPDNLWGTFRKSANPVASLALWKLSRTLQRSGWEVVADPNVIAKAFPKLKQPPFLAVQVRSHLAPVVHRVPDLTLSQSDELSNLVNVGCKAAVLTCNLGGLDDSVTLLRRWYKAQKSNDVPAVMILEAPRYAPGQVLTPNDSGIKPNTVTAPL